MGEGIMECTVLSLLKKTGDPIEIDDSVLEVATDKVDTEVPSSHTGILKEWLVSEGEVVQIGSPIGRIEVQGEATDSPVRTPQPAPDKALTQVAQKLEADMADIGHSISNRPRANQSQTDRQGANSGFYSPLVLSIAKEEGISAAELASIRGTGAENRITKTDLAGYLDQKHRGTASQPGAQAVRSGQVEILEMDRMRKMIAQRMIASRQTSAHVTSFVETDMTPIVQWRDRIKDGYRKKHGEGITFTPVLIQAVAKAIGDFPMINVSVEGDNILIKKDINIGMAVALPDGNLIVPVIHRADQYDLPALSHKVNDLARRARENKLKAEEVVGGTYSISNIGSFGNIMGTPIILQPQVAIMAFGAIQKKPAVIETPQGDLLGIRSMMFISHSYDHRVVDGSLGGRFVKRVSDYLENFDPETSY